MLRLTSFIASLPSYFSPATLDESTSVLFDDTEDLEDDAFEDAPTTIANATLESQQQQQQQHQRSVTSINTCISSSPCPKCQNVQISQTLATLPSSQFALCSRCTNAFSNNAKSTITTTTTSSLSTTTTTPTSTTLQLRHPLNRNAMQLSNASRRRFASASFPSASSSSSSEGKFEIFNETSQSHQIRRRSADDIAYFKEIGSYLRRVSEEFDRSSRSNLTNKFAITLTPISPSNSRSF